MMRMDRSEEIRIEYNCDCIVASFQLILNIQIFPSYMVFRFYKWNKALIKKKDELLKEDIPLFL
jgi:hypothetical protein